MNRRLFLKISTLTSAMSASGIIAGLAQAQGKYPDKPITFVVPQPAGGDADAFCRAIQASMQNILGQSVIIDNRGGAGGNIGTTVGANAKPDGYTFTFVNQGTMVFNPLIYPNPGYKIDQFDPVSLLASIDLIICANPSVPVNTMAEFIELAKKNPGKYTYGTAGNGSGNHMAGVLLEDLAKIDITHVPYKGGGPAIMGALSGDTSLVIAFPLAALPHIQSGKLKALAITGSKRSKALPNVPTVAESGVKGYDFSSWFGVVAPKGTPKDAVNVFSQATIKALKEPVIAEKFTSGLTQPIAGGPTELSALINKESKRWAPIVKRLNIQVD
jgi:tripartite-type tricarboxylate transporter receptor subunit TctC